MQNEVYVEKRYQALRAISYIYKILAFIVFFMCLIGSIILFASSGKEDKEAKDETSMIEQDSDYLTIGQAETPPDKLVGVTGGVIMFFTGIISSIGLFAFGELFSLLIALEENSRKTALILEQKEQY
ncbi:MAG: hypothetical protein ABIH42_06940 [Planctomycetota bacterium]